jgi:hypothetical protein
VCSPSSQARLIGQSFRFQIEGDFVDEDFEPIATWIQRQCKKLHTKTLAGVSSGNSELIVTFQAFFLETPLAVSSQPRGLIPTNNFRKPCCNDTP